MYSNLHNIGDDLRAAARRTADDEVVIVYLRGKGALLRKSTLVDLWRDTIMAINACCQREHTRSPLAPAARRESRSVARACFVSKARLFGTCASRLRCATFF
jgi:hypothetical protein